MTLAERLGYRATDRLVIVSCDDLGACHALNVGVFDALRTGTATSASLMVPAPWAREAAARYRGEDIGVHLTLNAEHELYRWGPRRKGGARAGAGRDRAARPARRRHARGAGPVAQLGRVGRRLRAGHAGLGAASHARASRRHSHRIPGATRPGPLGETRGAKF